MRSSVILLTFSLFIAFIVAHAECSESRFPRLSIPLLYSSPDTVLNACLGVNITFNCEFSDGTEVTDEYAVILANDVPIYRSPAYHTNRITSITFNATKLNATHPVSNFTCGTTIRQSSQANFDLLASQSNVVKIKFHECPEQHRRIHRLLAGKSITLVCPFYHSRPIEWDLDGFPLNQSDVDKYRSNFNGSSFTINNLTRRDSGVYRCFQKPHPLALGANYMSHDLTVLSPEKLIPDKLTLVKAGETSLNLTWAIELENRVGIRRKGNHSEPFTICYASMNDEKVSEAKMSTRAATVRILSLTPGTLYAMQPIGKSERCFERQDNVQFFATLSPGERWETGETARLLGRDTRAVDFVEGERKLLYCGGNLENLKSKNFTVDWFDWRWQIVMKSNDRRKVDPRTGALIFDKVYPVDSTLYRCNIRFHGSSGLIKGDHATDQLVYLNRNDTSDGYFGTNFQFKCTNSTENSITIEWQDETGGENEWREDGSPPTVSRPTSTLKFLCWVSHGMSNEYAPAVKVANSTATTNGIVLDNLKADAFYTIWITETYGGAERQYGMHNCWTDPIHDTLEVPEW